MCISLFCSKIRPSSFYFKMCFKIEIYRTHFDLLSNENKDPNDQTTNPNEPLNLILDRIPKSVYIIASYKHTKNMN